MDLSKRLKISFKGSILSSCLESLRKEADEELKALEKDEICLRKRFQEDCGRIYTRMLELETFKKFCSHSSISLFSLSASPERIKLSREHSVPQQFVARTPSNSPPARRSPEQSQHCLSKSSSRSASAKERASRMSNKSISVGSRSPCPLRCGSRSFSFTNPQHIASHSPERRYRSRSSSTLLRSSSSKRRSSRACERRRSACTRSSSSRSCSSRARSDRRNRLSSVRSLKNKLPSRSRSPIRLRSRSSSSNSSIRVSRRVDSPRRRRADSLKHKRIYVGNLPKRLKLSELVEIFGKFGALKSCKMSKNCLRHNKTYCRYGYVIYEKAEDAKKAVKQMDFKKVGNRRLECSFKPLSLIYNDESMPYCYSALSSSCSYSFLDNSASS